MAEYVTADREVIGTRENGTTYVQVARGDLVPYEDAVRLGLVEQPEVRTAKVQAPKRAAKAKE